MSTQHDDGADLRLQLRNLRRAEAAAILECDLETAERLGGEADEIMLQHARRQATQQQSAVEPAADEQTDADPRLTAINEAFNARFGDFDDSDFADAAALARVRLADPRSASLSPADFVEQIGSAVRRMHSQPAVVETAPTARTVQAPAAPSVEELQRSSRRSYVEQRLARQYGR
jgi:hypothetical protein